MESLVQEYLVDEDDNLQVSGTGEGELDEMAGYDFVGEDVLFFEKYGDQNGGEELYEEEDSFDNGYYF